MISKVLDSRGSQGIGDIINLFNIYKQAIYQYKNKIVSNLSSNISLSEEFLGSSSEEINDYFNYAYEELENVTCLSLLSAVEAKLRIDYQSRVYEKKKDTVSRKFRDIYKEKGGKPPLDEGILKAWMDSYPELKHIINDYKSALNYRNWLAHGRYWVPKLGRKYDIDIIYSISDNIISNLISIN
ncbi:MAG TPA: hypothetical protein VIM70_09580 [Clostridium sp.]|uniref:hypothetical protein n=1 Tax=Clostridium sp. TaxID=1506 RepID=UPI002F956447